MRYLNCLSDKRTPTCPNCGMAKLELEDVIDTFESGSADNPTLKELTIGVCPNCNHTFEYTQIYTHQPIGYEGVEDITEDEEDEENDY